MKRESERERERERRGREGGRYRQSEHGGLLVVLCFFVLPWLRVREGAVRSCTTPRACATAEGGSCFCRERDGERGTDSYNIEEEGPGLVVEDRRMKGKEKVANFVSPHARGLPLRSRKRLS